MPPRDPRPCTSRPTSVRTCAAERDVRGDTCAAAGDRAPSAGPFWRPQLQIGPTVGVPGRPTNGRAAWAAGQPIGQPPTELCLYVCVCLGPASTPIRPPSTSCAPVEASSDTSGRSATESLGRSTVITVNYSVKIVTD